LSQASASWLPCHARRTLGSASDHGRPGSAHRPMSRTSIVGLARQRRVRRTWPEHGRAVARCRADVRVQGVAWHRRQCAPRGIRRGRRCARSERFVAGRWARRRRQRVHNTGIGLRALESVQTTWRRPSTSSLPKVDRGRIRARVLRPCARSPWESTNGQPYAALRARRTHASLRF
jgi:hypothetical protein